MTDSLERAMRESIIAGLKFVGSGFFFGVGIGGLIYFFNRSPASTDLAILLSSVPIVFVVAYATPMIRNIWQLWKAVKQKRHAGSR